MLIPISSTMKNHLIYVIAISLVSALGGFLFGFDTAVISGTIPFVKSQFEMSNLALGWFVSSALLGCIFGVAVAGWLSDRFGRKRVLIVSALTFSLSALGCSLSDSETTLILYRLLGGIGVGIASMLSPMYIAEVSPPNIRGRMVTLYQFAITIGILIAYFANAWVLNTSENPATGFGSHLYKEEIWRGMFINELYPAFVFFSLLFLIPESPRWLITKGRDEKARMIMSRILPKEQLNQEYEKISSTIHHENTSIKQLLKPGMRTALLIGILLPMFSQLSGINAIIYYGPEILQKAGLTISNALGGQVTIGIVNVIFTIVALVLIDKWGRRPLLLTGLTGAAISLIVIGLLFFFGHTEGPLLLILILIFIACFAFSLGPIPWILISEIFPTQIRGKAMSIGTFSIWGTNAIVGLFFPVLLNSKTFGPSGTFTIFGVCCLIAIFFTWKIIPETKNKSLEEIEKIWT